MIKSKRRQCNLGSYHRPSIRFSSPALTAQKTLSAPTTIALMYSLIFGQSSSSYTELSSALCAQVTAGITPSDGMGSLRSSCARRHGEGYGSPWGCDGHFLPPMGVHTLLLAYSRHSFKWVQKQRCKPGRKGPLKALKQPQSGES